MTSVEVINAGLCRTGTMSTRKALVDMGFGECYHMQECFARSDTPIWMKCFEKDCFDPVIKLMSEANFKSGCDLPFCAIFEELLISYPKAKVVLTVRDDPQKWVDSWRRTVYKINTLPMYTEILRLSPPPLRYMAPSINNQFHDLFWTPIIKKGNSVSVQKVPEDVHTWDMTDEQMCQLYLNWTEYVKQKVPADQLIIFNVNEGIGPLSEFLGVDQSFGTTMPFLNDRNEFDQLTQMVKLGSSVQIIGYTGLALSISRRSRGSSVKYSKLIQLPFWLCIITPIAAAFVAQQTIGTDKLVSFL